MMIKKKKCFWSADSVAWHTLENATKMAAYIFISIWNNNEAAAFPSTLVMVGIHIVTDTALLLC